MDNFLHQILHCDMYAISVTVFVNDTFIYLFDSVVNAFNVLDSVIIEPNMNTSNGFILKQCLLKRVVTVL